MTSGNKLKSDSLQSLVLTSIFSAIVIVMSVIPYLGYISVGVIEITTLHIVTVLGAVCLGPLKGAIIGGVWGITCILRAYFVLPIYLDFGFGNFFVSMLPRILVGLVAGLIFRLLIKIKVKGPVPAIIAAAFGTFTNTCLVLTAMNIWLKIQGREVSGIFETFKSILSTLIGINGIIELTAAVVIVPAVYGAIAKYTKHNHISLG